MSRASLLWSLCRAICFISFMFYVYQQQHTRPLPADARLGREGGREMGRGWIGPDKAKMGC